MKNLHRSSAAGALAVTLLAVGLLVGGLGGAVAPASAAPGDQVSVSAPAFAGNFGAVKQGSVIPRTIELLNDGVDSITIDPAPLSALTAPFALTGTTLVAGDVIAPGQRRTVTVTLTAPPAPTTSQQKVTLTAVSNDRTGSTTLDLNLTSQSLTTDRAHFDVATPDGASTLAFGSIDVGTTVTKRVTLTVRGIDPLQFAEADVRLLGSTGAPATAVRVSASSFGAGKTSRPGETATLDLTFSPTAAGSVTGTVVIVGRPMNGNPETPGVVVELPFTAAGAVAPTPTPTATPTPSPTPTATGTPRATATPGATGLPTASSTGGAGMSGGNRGTGSAVSTPSLASTGADPALAGWLGALMLLVGAAAAALGVRRRRAAR